MWMHFSVCVRRAWRLDGPMNDFVCAEFDQLLIWSGGWWLRGPCAKSLDGKGYQGLYCFFCEGERVIGLEGRIADNQCGRWLNWIMVEGINRWQMVLSLGVKYSEVDLFFLNKSLGWRKERIGNVFGYLIEAWWSFQFIWKILLYDIFVLEKMKIRKTFDTKTVSGYLVS